MGNMLEKPILYLPVVISSAIMGGLGAVFDIQGTPMSAGFGFSGLVGPLTAYGFMAPGWLSILSLSCLFVVLPVLLGYLMKYIFIDKRKLISATDLLLKTD